MSSLRNSVQRRNHAERSQPARRQHLGILEKHKDYKLRATDYHKKQDTLKKLREKARFRNEDEFYFKMINTKTKGGVHIKERSGVLGADIMKLLRTQDSNYIQQMINIEQKQIEKLKDGLSFIDEGQEEEEEEEEEEEGFKAKKKVKHTIFVDEDENIESFDVADHFDTLPSLVEQKHLRLRKSTLKNKPLDPDFMKKELLEQRNEQKKGEYAHLKERMERLDQLKLALRESEIQKSLLGKGKKEKIGKDSRGLTIWKFQQVRKK